MDSLTQIALGAAVGGLTLHKTHGRKGVLVGAIAGLIPDLDVFIPMGDPVSDFTYHRGVTHSLIFCVVFTPIMVWVLSKIKYFNIQMRDKTPYIAVFLSLWTHALLDAMTIYGTQLWWPLSSPPVGIGSVFIIDPLYSLPLLFCLCLYLFKKWQKSLVVGLCLTTAYLGWSMMAQSYVYTIAKPQLEQANQILVQPTPLNTILWRVLAMEDGVYKVGYYSLFDQTTEITFENFDNDILILPDNWAVQRLKWFTKGFYGVRQEGEAIVLSDLRMGLEPDDYVFQFIVNKNPNERFVKPRNTDRLFEIWQRMLRDL